MKKQKPSG